jgi:hypothetical protein
MTEEQSNNESIPIEKLLIDEPLNFQFHAAYLVYSETFDKTMDAQAKTDLNMQINDLKENKISTEEFYQNISRHRKLSGSPRQERFSMQTQRKKDWRMKTQRQDRIRRHKK